jgi:hypothetical protein
MTKKPWFNAALRVAGLLALPLILLIAGCGMVLNGGFYDEDTLGGKLEGLEPNTAQDPYTIALNSSVSIKMDTTAAQNAWASINATIADNKKFVVLDLRLCSAPTTISGGFGDIIYANQYIKGIFLPATLTGIGRNAFAGCAYLTSVIIPTGVTSIAASAFSGCDSLASVTIPASVTSIGDHAFYTTTASLTSVTFGGSETSFSRDYDESFPYSASLYSAYVVGGAGTYMRNGRSWAKR